MLFLCWSDVEDGGQTLKQHWLNASCLLGYCTVAAFHHYRNVFLTEDSMPGQR